MRQCYFLIVEKTKIEELRKTTECLIILNIRNLERRSDKDRRSIGDRRTGMYHKLPEFQKKTLDGILNRLEDLLEEER